MDDLEDLRASEFVTDTEDQDSLDERIDSEQRLRNQQLWASFQNAACCITKLYKDRTQPNVSPWAPFQHAASNLTTLYKDCIESQRRFARIGYQVGRRRRMREFNRLIKIHKMQQFQAKQQQQQQQQQVLTASSGTHGFQDHTSTSININDSTMAASAAALGGAGAGAVVGVAAPVAALGGGQSGKSNVLQHQQHNTVASSILAVNQLNLGSDELTPSNSTLAQSGFNQLHLQPQPQQQQQANLQILLGNNEEDLFTFQQALIAQPPARGAKACQARRPYSQGYQNNGTLEHGNSDERLLELNQFLSEEYHRHVGSKKRSCSSSGGTNIKRFRE